MMSVSQERAIQRSISVLAGRIDEMVPGWYAEIDSGTLDISDPHNCVVGQLFNIYHGSVIRYEEGIKKATGLPGYHLMVNDIRTGPIKVEDCFANGEHYWRKEIQRRLADELVEEQVEKREEVAV